MSHTEADLGFMRQAIACAGKDRRLEVNGGKKGGIGVGAVLVTSRGEVHQAYGAMFDTEHHAEATIFHQLEGQDLAGSTLYTTLEPCTTRNHNDHPCADWIKRRGVSRVFIGMPDPNPDIANTAFSRLEDESDGRVSVESFPAELRREIEKGPMKEFIDEYNPNKALAGILKGNYYTTARAVLLESPFKLADLSDYIHRENQELRSFSPALPLIKELEEIVSPFYREPIQGEDKDWYHQQHTRGAIVVGYEALYIRSSIVLLNKGKYNQHFQLRGRSGTLPGYGDNNLEPSFNYNTHFFVPENINGIMVQEILPDVLNLESGEQDYWNMEIKVRRQKTPGIEDGMPLAIQRLKAVMALESMLSGGIKGLAYRINLVGNKSMEREFGVKIEDPEQLLKPSAIDDIPGLIAKVEDLQRLSQQYWDEKLGRSKPFN